MRGLLFAAGGQREARSGSSAPSFFFCSSCMGLGRHILLREICFGLITLYEFFTSMHMCYVIDI
jgi:hypothetical protein